MNIIDSNEEGTRALGYVFALLSAHRDVIRLVWETAQGEWVYATRMASETEFHEDEDGADQ
ncbi:hypothetical protein [Frankia sp. R82]|uniref:hypothetical protein n=1 Tax=Frankia sp. R82 TaxID=2950553 RepID=UPI002043BED5|nr:hypothetical protein [Frankia sp. R82]MCM3882147.1 hypothetical protein [Frankia sp. R82]